MTIVIKRLVTEQAGADRGRLSLSFELIIRLRPPGNHTRESMLLALVMLLREDAPYHAEQIMQKCRLDPEKLKAMTGLVACTAGESAAPVGQSSPREEEEEEADVLLSSLSDMPF